MVGAAQMGMDFRAAAPSACQPKQELVDTCRTIAQTTGAKITVTDDPEEAVRDCDFLYTDVWVSMGEPASLWAERIEMLLPYQVNRKRCKRPEIRTPVFSIACRLITTRRHRLAAKFLKSLV